MNHKTEDGDQTLTFNMVEDDICACLIRILRESVSQVEEQFYFCCFFATNFQAG